MAEFVLWVFEVLNMDDGVVGDGRVLGIVLYCCALGSTVLPTSLMGLMVGLVGYEP